LDEIGDLKSNVVVKNPISEKNSHFAYNPQDMSRNIFLHTKVIKE
jgi:hypothetical protein